MSKVKNEFNKELKPLYTGAETLTIEGTGLHISEVNGRNEVSSDKHIISCPFCFNIHTEEEFWKRPNERQELFDEGFHCLECGKYFIVNTSITKMFYSTEEPYQYDQ